MAPPCAGCLQQITNRRYLMCNLCHNKYDLKCANITTPNFLRLTVEDKTAWNCQLCRCKKPKGDNTNTPIRPVESNLTKRNTSPGNKKTDGNASLYQILALEDTNNDCTHIDDEISVIGDTFQPQSPNIPHSQIDTMLNKLETLIDQKFEHNKLCVITEIKQLIAAEICKALNGIKIEFSTNFREITQGVNNNKVEINNLTKQIENLETICFYTKYKT
ncbi:unnamed protein product [Spodoptera littoralis]|uniref:PHD-type domain-containing protein n=1 Tax=Spodoptera littoralis TaxID=7109 RepID=A0A9P0I592_SPOLI|nr:unnamed protein product [Spodoptera littoralis]